jgi:nitrous oxidase accessory protein NosD
VVGAQGAASVLNSRIVGNASDGVWVDGNAALDLRTTQVVGNQVGVFVSGEGIATLAGNEILDNVRAGVVATDAGRADLQGNTIARSPIGVHLSSTAAVQGADNVFAEVGQQVLDGR